MRLIMFWAVAFLLGLSIGFTQKSQEQYDTLSTRLDQIQIMVSYAYAEGAK